MRSTPSEGQEMMDTKNQRLIEHGFPCHQVGAETQRERGASSALPPLYYLHVWWARRPLTPSRAAILASLLPAEADDSCSSSIGLEKVEVVRQRRAMDTQSEGPDMLSKLSQTKTSKECQLAVDVSLNDG